MAGQSYWSYKLPHGGQLPARHDLRGQRQLLRSLSAAEGRKSHKLCDRDETHSSTSAPSFLALADEHMVEVRRRKPSSGAPTIADYWANVYLPTVTTHLKDSTVEGYRQLWSQHLEPHFTGRKFAEYETLHANQLLNKLIADGYGKRTIQHVRSLASSVFAHALNDGRQWP